MLVGESATVFSAQKSYAAQECDARMLKLIIKARLKKCINKPIHLLPVAYPYKVRPVVICIVPYIETAKTVGAITHEKFAILN